jgi:hypothetical protein
MNLAYTRMNEPARAIDDCSRAIDLIRKLGNAPDAEFLRALAAASGRTEPAAP